ncbi:MAG TPA: IclR family transcriptional regulator C-terminal domain-containing protein [Solirubrobacteraceae bacterium]
MTEAVAPTRDFVQSLARGLAVIRALDAREPLTLSEVARASDLSRAAARRFLLTLDKLGYVRQAGGRFELTARVLELGFSYLSALGLPDLAEPHLEELVERVHESSSVSVLDDTAIVYVARVPTRRIMAVMISVGTRLPAYATSMGRVLLAGLEAEALAERLERIELEPLAHDTITTRAQLEAELDRVRLQGHAIVDQELEPGLRSVAVPIRDRSNNTIAAINLAVDASRVSVQEIRRSLLEPLLAAAAAIERDLAAAGTMRHRA